MFQSLVEEENWSFVVRLDDSIAAYDLFLTRIKELYDQSFPMVPFKRNRKSRKPWIGAALLRRIKQ